MNKSNLVESLLAWFYREKRDLPWRKSKNPYHVWVSEIMLQQTRVDTVIPYYERFMGSFPTLSDLANASEEEVLKHWEGLGYYSRARNLHAAVKEVVTKYGGVVPSEEEEISKLKGIGPYTKGAILSIAYDKPVPAVDGNVLRVISRLFAIEKDIAKQSVRKEIEAIVQTLIPKEDPSGFNQALMELGALICVPRSPKCSICPVQEECVGKEQGKADKLPIKNVKEKKRDVDLITMIFQQDEKVLIHQRNEALLKGLWEYPSWEKSKEEQLTADRLSSFSLSSFGIYAEQFHYLGKIEHIFSHLRWKIEVYFAPVEEITENIEEKDASYRWVDIKDLEHYPFPVPHQKVRNLWKKR